MNKDFTQIKKLRELTGVGITDAKKALEESEGNFEQALAQMRKKGMTKAESRQAREARAGKIGSYIHDGRIGVLVEVNCETDFVAKNEIFNEFVKDICLHIAASAPLYLVVSDVPEEERKRVYKELEQKALKDGKKKEIVQKIVLGQVEKHFSQLCLLSQPFVKDQNITVELLLKQKIAKLGENIVIRRFYRMALGEVIS